MAGTPKPEGRPRLAASRSFTFWRITVSKHRSLNISRISPSVWRA